MLHLSLYRPNLGSPYTVIYNFSCILITKIIKVTVKCVTTGTYMSGQTV